MKPEAPSQAEGLLGAQEVRSASRRSSPRPGCLLRALGALRQAGGMQPIRPRASMTEFCEEAGPVMRRTTSFSAC